MNNTEPILNTKRLLLSLLVFAISAPGLPGQAPEGLEWEHLGPEQGLGMSFLDILQDHQGFIWLGSTNGLYRYDGYQIRPFKKYSNKPTGLSSDWVWDLEEDKDGNIWIATYDGGLNKWERASGRIAHFVHDAADPASLRGNNVMKILADPAGDIWAVVKTPGGAPALDRLDPATGKVAHYGAGAEPASLSCDTVAITAFQAMQFSPLYLGPDGDVWVATEDGLNRYDRKTDGFRHFRHEAGKPNSLPYRKVLAVEASKKEDGVYWVRTASPGLKHIALSRLDIRTGAIRQLAFGGKTQGHNCLGLSLSPDEEEAWISDRTLDFYTGKNFRSPVQHSRLGGRGDELRLGIFRHSSGALLLPQLGMNPLEAVRASDNYETLNGISFLGPQHEQPYFISQNPLAGHAAFGEVYCITEGRSGIIWLGCSRGVYKLKIPRREGNSKPVFENYFRGNPEKGGLPSTDIRDVYEESPTVFWLASCGGGLNRLSRRTGEVRHFSHDPARPNSLGSNKIYALWRRPGTGQLWIGHEKGVDVLGLDDPASGDPSTATFRRIRQDDGFLDGRINELKPDGSGKLWIGTADHGLLLWDPDAGKMLERIVFEKHNPDPAHSAFINEVFTDSRGRTWVAPGMGGLCRLSREGGSFEYECFLDGLFIVDFFEGPGGKLWCAAMNYGILIFDPVSETHELVNMENRLVRNSVTGIEADTLGRIWFTSVGLSHYDPGEDTYKVYGRDAGLIDLDPERCFYKSRAGELFYAAPNGALQIFSPEVVIDNPVTPRPVLTNFKLFNKTVELGEDGPLEENIEVASRIHLAHHQHSFSFEFAGLEFTRPAGNQYRYQLEGVDKGWVFSGTHREARYTSVRPGKYLFKVQAANSDGVWNEEPAAIQLIISPPWWNRWWAYLLFVALFFTPILLIYRYQLKRQAALEEARRLKEVDELKTRLYTNITHEFRTPLTVVLGMAEQVIRQPDKWFHEGLRMIIRNGQNLLRLVNQMLDLRKIESGTMRVDLRLGDVATFLRYLTESFHSFAESKGIGLHYQSPLEEFVMDYDEDKLLKILSNLLSNAIRFTPEGGRVYVLVDSLNRKGEELLEIRVKDTGIGIPAGEQGRIFERFYSLPPTPSKGVGGSLPQSPQRGEEGLGRAASGNAPQSGGLEGAGAGIGLALASELVKLLRGSFAVESRPGAGSTFTVLLPVSRTAAERHTFREEKVEQFAGQFIATDPEPDGEAEALLGGDCEGKPMALVIEDNRDVVHYLRSCLEEGYCVQAAYDGKVGIRMAIELVPDIIISDVMMPEKDGFEVADTLKRDERTSHIPIILLTARATMEDRIMGLERGADAYLSKPFDREELRVSMQKLIELRRRLQERYSRLQSPPAPAQPALEMEDNFVRKVRELVEARLDDPDFSIDEVSDAIFLSRTQVHRKLKALTGLSTGHFIRSIRLAHALRLLQTTSKSVTEIAMDVGFKDHAYFSRVFAAEYGKAPSEMRG